MDDIIFEDRDLKFKDGDFDIENSDQQGIEFIVRARPGHFLQWPTLGIGIDSQKMGTIDKQSLRADIKKHLIDDDYRINKIEIGSGLDELITSIDASK